MINLVALPCLCVDVFDGTDELRAGGEALNFAVHASRFEGINVSLLAADVKTIVDTTGCGDSYHAGFVCSHMMNEDIYEAMKAGTEFAAQTLSHYGGF